MTADPSDHHPINLNVPNKYFTTFQFPWITWIMDSSAKNIDPCKSSIIIRTFGTLYFFKNMQKSNKKTTKLTKHNKKTYRKVTKTNLKQLKVITSKKASKSK